jgi:hypothetical protein
MSQISDEMLGAYVDGELPTHDRTTIDRALAADPALQRRLAAQQALRMTLQAHFGPVAEERLPAHLRDMLAAPATADVVPLRARTKTARRFTLPHYAAIAASLALGLFAGQMLSSRPSGPVAAESGGLVAQGSLARALDSQLASAQPPGSATRIGLTFEDQAGRFCRTFETAELGGIGCHEGGSWRIVATSEGGGEATEYRPASAPLLADQVDRMIAGAPFDAQAEKRARDRGWKRD